MNRKPHVTVFVSMCFGLAVIVVLYVLKKPEHFVFPEIHIFTNQNVSVLNFGDVMFDRGVRNIIENRGRDPFEYIKKDLDKITGYDVVIANLEGPIVVMDRKDCQQKAYNFQFAPDTTDRLKSIGINMVNIANNHAYDCYSQGFESTKNYLKKAGIEYIGDSAVDESFVLKNIKGKKIAFVGLDRTVSATDIAEYYELIKKLKSENDFIVVDIHWGTEYLPSETDEQVVVAHRLVDSGADIIFGHHPHVVEPVRIYKGKAIFYSLGNFVFDQVGENENTGVGVGAEFGRDKIGFDLLPYKIKLFTPDFLTEPDKNSFCDTFLNGIVHNGCHFDISDFSL